ncbi:PQQ-dependent dehydrogenase, methanol/ethanol family [Sphingomonas sp. MMS24-J13]|uniref:PQQ-dependent dehydrogenase, methanol/ethanol family n=1 Tax=Sphingomonas sp. MMS24-J13 TaxID=3238686 RepID=UPI003851174D
MPRAKLRHIVLGLGLVSAAALAASNARPRAAAVDQHRLDNAASEPGNWMTYGGSYAETRFSPLNLINERTVARLKPAWVVDLDTARGQEATPLVVDGVMYTSTAWSKVMALDAATGRVLWRYDPHVIGGKAVHTCCDVVNRGVAVWKGKVYVGTVDDRLIALDARTGKEVWSVVTADQKQAYTITGAPRVFKDKVVIGNSGAELGVRGYVTAYDTETGRKVWRFYTVPGNPANGPDHEASDEAMKIALPTWAGEWWKYGGGGTVWDSMVYDADLDQLLLGVGNGSPWNHQIRSDGKGDNLFLSSIVALDPDTGRYKWHYQETPGESWDFTATQQITLATLDLGHGPQKVIVHAPKNGFVFVIDRTNGKLLSANPYVETNWATGYDLATGRPKEVAAARYHKGSYMVTPSGLGAHAWMPMSYDPVRHIAYIPSMQAPLIYGNDPNFEYHPGRWNTATSMGGAAPNLPADPAARAKAMAAMSRGTLIAWDVVKGKPLWKVEHGFPWNGGTLATAGGLVFEGDYKGQFAAYRATDGKKLWSIETHRGIGAGPMTYTVGGHQYLAVMAGYGGSMGMATPWPGKPFQMPNGQILVFRLDGTAKLPAYKQQALPPANPSTDSFTDAQRAEGGKWFGTYCWMCHGGPVNPDLRRSGALPSADAWKAIVIDGALEPAGMASFRDYLKPDQVESIRAYISKQAERLKEAEAKGQLPPSLR